MADSSEEEVGRPGRGKILQRQKRELKELLEQQKKEASKLTPFAKAKRENDKIRVRAEKREFEEKYRLLKEDLAKRHADELIAAGFEPELPKNGEEEVTESLAGLGVADPVEAAEETGTRKSKQQKKKEQLAWIEKELREEAAPCAPTTAK
eukprot:TRINITY_DN65720_c0_g1_i1.p1 TRINITY_DN65720_c0_g1~~TRINITY_DN65720_c0_g1_i1.p1  ORF type:complete len:151 (+),score=66.58 TRINITY_DN65720_c0_g1_i1:61-513(+)